MRFVDKHDVITNQRMRVQTNVKIALVIITSKWNNFSIRNTKSLHIEQWKTSLKSVQSLSYKNHSALTVCMVFIPTVVMAKLLAHVSITHDNNNFFGSLYQYFSFGNEMVGRF